MVEVVVTDEFRSWYEGLTESEQESVRKVVTRLEQVGVALGAPYSKSLVTSKHGLLELRIQHAGRPFRAAYGFDPKRQAVILLGADKGGVKRFYERFVPKADRIWEDYLKQTK